MWSYDSNFIALFTFPFDGFGNISKSRRFASETLNTVLLVMVEDEVLKTLSPEVEPLPFIPFIDA